MTLIVTYNFIAWSMRPSLVVSMDTSRQKMSCSPAAYSQVSVVKYTTKGHSTNTTGRLLLEIHMKIK